MAFAPNGLTLATASSDETVRLWDVATEQQQAILQGHTNRVNSVAFAPNGQTLATASEDETVRLWDVATRQQQAVLQGHTNPVNSVAFAPNGQTLATASDDETVRLWDVATRQQQAVLQGHTNPVNSVAFAPNGQTLATASDDETVLLWDVSGGLTGIVRHFRRTDDDRTARSQEVATRQQQAVLQGHTNRVNSVAFAPNGQTLATASDDETVRLWDVATGQQQAVLQGHTSWVLSVAFSPDGQTLATASWDGTILLWDMAPYILAATSTAVDAAVPVPTQTALLPNYPNPFNSRTQLAYRLAAPGLVRLDIYNALGQPVRTLVNQIQDAGEYQVAWDARDGQGAAVATGYYVTRLSYPGGRLTRPLLYIK